MRTIEQVNEELRALRNEQAELETQEKIERLTPLVGKHFRYRNSYSCPEGPADYWWLYCKVLSIDENGCLQVLQSQRDKDGCVSIEIQTRCYWHDNDGHRPITPAVYQRGVQGIMESVKNFLPEAQ